MMTSANLITFEDIKKLRVAHTRRSKLPITMVDFHYNGERLLFNDEDTITILKITPEAVVTHHRMDSAKRGAGICKMLEEDYVVHTFTKKNIGKDHQIGLLCLNGRDSSYVRYFPGNSKEVTSLEVGSRMFFTGSKDTSVRAWDLRDPKCCRFATFPSETLIALDPTENFIAVAYNSSFIEIYHKGNFKKCECKFTYERTDGVEWTSIKYSADGEKILITTNGTKILVVNARKQEELNDIYGHTNPQKTFINACFDPTGNYVFGGSQDGHVHIWGLKASYLQDTLKIPGGGLCHDVAFNPRFMNIATVSGSKLNLWIEKEDY